MDDLLFPGCEKCVRLHRATLEAHHPVAELDAWLDYLGHIHVGHGALEQVIDGWWTKDGQIRKDFRNELIIRGGGKVPTPLEKVAR